MKTIDIKKELPLLVLTLLPVCYTIYIWPQLPAQIPIHYDLHGDVNGWGSKATAFLMPGISVVSYILLLFLPQIDPRRMSGEFFINNFYKIRLVLSVALLAFSILITHLSLSGTPDTHEVKLIPAFALLLLAVLGNFMINIKPNWFIGVRTPWTLSSDHVWKQTHLVFGRLWFYGGIVATAGIFILPDSMGPALILTFVLGTSAFAFIYSYWLYRQEQHRAGQNQ